jgi:hypothetical protein
MDKLIMNRKEREQLTVFKELNCSGCCSPNAGNILLGGSGKSSSDIVFLEIRGLFITRQ